VARLPELLGSVQAQLVAFLASVEEWATRYAPPVADALVAKLDEGLAITAPLRDKQS
jgi:malate synthase